MKFNELKEEVKKIGCEELRLDDKDYLEAVFPNEKIVELSFKLESFLGKSVWPSLKNLSPKTEQAVNGYGGVRSGQTLYFKDSIGGVMFAMLWPWGDGQRTTLKLIKK